MSPLPPLANTYSQLYAISYILMQKCMPSIYVKSSILSIYMNLPFFMTFYHHIHHIGSLPTLHVKIEGSNPIRYGHSNIIRKDRRIVITDGRILWQ